MRARKKLNLFVILSSLFAGLSVIGLTFLVGSNFLVERTQQAFQMQTYFTLRELDRLFFERSSDIEVLSRTLEPLTENKLYPQLEEVFFTLRDYTRSYQNFEYVDENFIKRVDTNRMGIGEKVEWLSLRKAQLENKVIFDFFEDPSSQTKVITFVKHLISAKGVKSGYVIGNVPFSTISRIARLSKENTHYKIKNRVELLREDGEIVYSSYRSDKFDSALAANFKKHIRADSKFKFLKSEGNLWSFGLGRAFFTLESLNWLLVMSTKESDVYEPLKATIFILFGLLSIAAIIFWFVISNITRAMLNPLESASAAIQKFGHGDLRALENIQVPEDDLGILIKNLKNMGGQIQELMTQRAQNARVSVLGEMAGNIAHEINNPLQVISIRLELIQKSLKMGQDLDKIEANIDIASQTVFRISKIVKGLKALSREGDADPFAPVTIQEILDNVLVLCQGSLKNSMISLECSCQQPNFKVECRAVQVTQVLLNLINNAHDAVKDSREKWIRLDIQIVGEEVEFRVRNSGPKISNQLVAKIFDPFYTTKRAGEGTGLGLSISLKIAKEHHGSLYVDLNDEHTCFVFRIATKSSEVKIEAPISP